MTDEYEPQHSTVEQMRAQFIEDQARWERRRERSQRIARWSLIPYGIAGITFGVSLSYVADCSPRLALVQLVGLLVLMAAQWGAPYLTRRGDRKDSISAPEVEIVGTVEDVRDKATE